MFMGMFYWPFWLFISHLNEHSLNNTVRKLEVLWFGKKKTFEVWHAAKPPKPKEEGKKWVFDQN